MSTWSPSNSLVNDTLQALEDGGCVRVNEDNTIEALVMGTVASQYYLHYTTVALFSANIRADTSIEVSLFFDFLGNFVKHWLPTPRGFLWPCHNSLLLLLGWRG